MSNIKFEKAHPKFRSELLNLGCDQLKGFCDQIQYFMDNYNPKWDIYDQLILDQSLCDYHNRDHQHLGLPHVTQLKPIILIQGFLPFPIIAENRTDLLLSLKQNDFIQHCVVTEVYLTNYMEEYSSWEQLILDFSTCMHSQMYKKRLIDNYLPTLDETLFNITRNISTYSMSSNISTTSSLYTGPIYMHGGYLSRKNIEEFSDKEINEFCDRVLWLSEYYSQGWRIQQQIEADMIACYLQITIRNNFTRVNTNSSKDLPQIMVRGEVLYNKQKSIWRLGQLLSMEEYQLKKHCEKTAALLKDYNQMWGTFEEMIWDANFCSVQLAKFDPNYNTSSNNFLRKLPEQISSNALDINMETCSTLGFLILENWRLGENKEDLLKSIRACLWKITPHILCIPDNKEYKNFNEITDFNLLKMIDVADDWEMLTSKSAAEVYNIFMKTIAQIHFLFTNNSENIKLQNFVEICLHIFSKENFYETEINGFREINTKYYFANDKIVLMGDNTPTCNNSLAATLQILFPTSNLGTAYSQRDPATENAFVKYFMPIWETKRSSTLFFSDFCKSLSELKPRLYTKSKLCGDLKYTQENSSVPLYCAQAISAFNQTDNDPRDSLQKLNNMQNCLRILVCPDFDCRSVTLDPPRFTPTDFDFCANITDDILRKNFKLSRFSLPTLQNITANFNYCISYKTNSEYPDSDFTNSTVAINKNDFAVLSLFGDENGNISADERESIEKSTNIVSEHILVKHKSDEVEKELSTLDDDLTSPVALPFAALSQIASGILTGLGPALASLIGSTAATNLAGAQPKSSKPRISKRKKPKRRKMQKPSKESKDEDSDSSSTEKEITTTEKPEIKTSTTELTTSTTQLTTTTPPDSFCWLEPPVLDEITEKRKKRSPPSRFLEESSYPSFPLGLCRLNFNELNSYQDQKTSFEFIEIVKQCKPGGRKADQIPSKHLSKYMVVIIDGESQQIIFSAALSNAIPKKEGSDWFLTIGPANK